MARSHTATLPSDTAHTGAAAEHVAAMARALVALGPMATTVSTRQRVSDEEATLIERLLPRLVDRSALEAVCAWEGEELIVTFRRSAA